MLAIACNSQIGVSYVQDDAQEFILYLLDLADVHMYICLRFGGYM